MKINELKTPCYVIDEGKLTENLKILHHVMRHADAIARHHTHAVCLFAVRIIRERPFKLQRIEIAALAFQNSDGSLDIRCVLPQFLNKIHKIFTSRQFRRFS